MSQDAHASACHLLRVHEPCHPHLGFGCRYPYTSIARHRSALCMLHTTSIKDITLLLQGHAALGLKLSLGSDKQVLCEYTQHMIQHSTKRGLQGLWMHTAQTVCSVSPDPTPTASKIAAVTANTSTVSIICLRVQHSLSECMTLQRPHDTGA